MRVGTVLKGRYRLIRQIGVGGMGSIWEARDERDDRRVAIKALHLHLVEEKALVTRFLREAQAALEARYSGHIIEVYDVVHEEGQAPYLVMEFLEGEDLKDILEREGALEPRRAVDLTIQTCDALDEVHRHGFVHRDVKPENLFVTHLKDGSEWIKLLDFGVVKLGSSSTGELGLTDFGSTLGTPVYMAPEQVTSPADVNASADIYATGVVLYELLTAQLPFYAESIREVAKMLAKRKPPLLRQHRPELSKELEAVVMKAMSYRPRKRFSTIFAFAEALQPFSSAGGGGRVSEPRKPRRINTLKESPETVDDLLMKENSERRKTRKEFAPLLLIFVVVVVMLCAGALALFKQSCFSGAGDGVEDGGLTQVLDEPVDVFVEDAPYSDAGAHDADVKRPVKRRSEVPRYIKRRIVATLRKIGPGIRRCLKGNHRPGTRVLVHFWIGGDGRMAYRKSRPPIKRASEQCIRRFVKTQRTERTRRDPFVVTFPYFVPR